MEVRFSDAHRKHPTHLLILAQVVARLLAAGAGVSLEDKRGRTALAYAEKLNSAATPRTREMELLSGATH